jgi:hypothetical protein
VRRVDLIIEALFERLPDGRRSSARRPIAGLAPIERSGPESIPARRGSRTTPEFAACL